MIDLENRPAPSGIHVEIPPDEGHAGIGDRQAHLQLIGGLVELVDPRRVGQVGDEWPGRPFVAKRSGNVGHPGINVDHHHAQAARDQRFGKGQPHPLGGTGHNRPRPVPCYELPHLTPSK